MSSSETETALLGASLVEQYGGLAPFIRNVGIGGVLLAAIEQVISLISSTGTVFLAPFRALGSGLAALVDGTLGTGVDVIAAGGETTITSLTTGLAAYLGPLAFPASVAISMAAVYVFVRLVSEISFSPTIFAGSD